MSEDTWSAALADPLGSPVHRSLRERTQAAWKELAEALHRRRSDPARREAVREAEHPGSETARAIEALGAELSDERSGILEPLLQRLGELANRLTSGERVAVGLLREGVELWGQYVQQLHDVHIRQLTALESPSGTPGTTEESREELEQDTARSSIRVGETRTMLRAYERDPALNASLLGEILLANLRSELAWERFEEEYLRSSLPGQLSAEELDRWRRELARTRAAGRMERDRVVAFLRRTESPSARRAAETTRGEKARSDATRSPTQPPATL